MSGLIQRSILSLSAIAACALQGCNMPASASSMGTFTVSATGKNVVYGDSCSIIIKVRNDKDDLLKDAFVQAAALDRDGQIIGTSITHASNIRAGASAVENLTFTNVPCQDIASLGSLNGGSSDGDLEVDPESPIPLSIA